MLPFFPSPRPDELLYSVCARYHVRSGNASVKDTVQDLFGSRSAAAVIDLPSRLAYLSSQLSPKTLNTPDKLIRDHTLLPLYRPFLPPDRLERVVTSMKGSDRGGTIHTMIGAMASAIPTLRFLRWCPDCATSDCEQYGEAYWHRSHQVAGVTVCHRHDTDLMEHTEFPVSDKNKHLFQRFPEAVTKGQPLRHCHGGREHRLAIAKGIARLVNHSNTPLLGLDALHDRYLSFLRRRDLASYSGHIAQHELLNAFIAFYGRDYLDEVHSAIDRDSTYNWLSVLVRKPRADKTSHPVRHLLLMRFLGVEFEDFFGAIETEKGLFGSGPWPCLNPVAPHYKQPVITQCSVTRNCESGRPVGNFYCSCGFNYARTGPDTSEEDRFRRSRMLAFGPVWEAELLRLMREEKPGLLKTARRLGVDPNTVNKHLKRLETEPGDVQGEAEEEDKVQEYRARWFKLSQENPNIGKKALRVLAPAMYTWLYRKDREWLLLQATGQTPPKVSVLRVDWEVRDAKFAVDVVAAAEAIRKQPGHPARITLSAIGKKLGLLALLQKKLHKLPRTEAALEEVLEDQDTYSIRRVRYAAASITEEGIALEEWRVVREAALRPGYSTAVQAEIQRVVAAGIVGSFP